MAVTCFTCSRRERSPPHQSLLAFAEEKSVASEEVALFFGPTAHPVGVSTEGILGRPFHAELVLATLQRSVVDTIAPTAIDAAAIHASDPLSGKAGAVARPPDPAASDNHLRERPVVATGGRTAPSDIHMPPNAIIHRAAHAQLLTQHSTDLAAERECPPANPPDVSLLDDTRADGGGLLKNGEAQLMEDPDSLLLDSVKVPPSRGVRTAPVGPLAGTGHGAAAPPRVQVSVSLTQLPGGSDASQEF